MLCPNCYGRGWRGWPVPENVIADIMSGEGRFFAGGFKLGFPASPP